MMIQALIYLALASVTAAGTTLLKDCGGTVFHGNSVTLSPTPMTIPGVLTIGIDVTLKNVYSGGKVQIEIIKKTSFGNIKVPCLFNIGSCTYDDVCNILTRMEKENWLNIAAGLAEEIRHKLGNAVKGDGCPFMPQTLKASVDIDLPKLPSVFKTFTDGDYVLSIKLLDNAGGQLGCFSGEFVMQSQSKGWLFV